MLDKAKAREIALKYVEEVKKTLAPIAIVLFGSYNNGTPHEHSDIDIAIIVDNHDEDWLDTASFLCKLTRSISIDIEPHLLDIAHDKSGLVAHILKEGEILYATA